MDQRLTNTWIGQKYGRGLFRTNHYFITQEKSLCGAYTIWPEDEKYLIPIKFNDIFTRKICQRCVLSLETIKINYKS